jgi:two-component system KDP operon response regulator KdpE
MILRTHVAAVKIETPVSDFFVGDGIEFDLRARQVRVGTKAAHLTPKEMRLLRYLISRHGRIVTHQELLLAVWGAKSIRRLNYLHVFVSNLRKKIEPDPAGPRYILTEPWVGYIFSIPDRPEET